MRSRIYFFILMFIISLIPTLTLLTFWANKNINSQTRKYNTNDLNEIKEQKTGLLLGTSKYLSSGFKNEYFFNRIDAAVKLYKNGKIRYIIISGDNSRKDYDEPTDMKNELVKRGIPEDNIYLDFAGFRTLDSVIRAKEIFGQNSIVIISQKFHNERAIFLARKNGIEAFGFNAANVSHKSYKTQIREIFARVKVYYDLLFNIEPKFYGEKITIPE